MYDCLQTTKAPPLFYQWISELLSIIHSTYNKVIIAGDFNLHIDKKSDPTSIEFLNLLNCMDFKQHVTQSTHNRGHTLDLVITYGLSAGVSSVMDLAVSDHYCVFFNITSFIRQEVPVRTVWRRHLTPEVAANFIDILHNSPPEILPAPCNFLTTNFNNKLKSALDSVAPLVIKTVKNKPTSPWIDIELKRKRRSAERKWRKSKLTVHYQIFRENQKIYNNTTKQARTAHFSKLISDKKNDHKFLLHNWSFNQQ